MSPQKPTWQDHAIAALPAIGALWITWMVVSLCLQRLDFPFDIEWMEGGMLVHALRLRQDLPLYAAPSPDWVPYIYPPFYPWLISIFGEPSYLTGRSISLVGTLLAAGAAVFALWREGRSPLWGVVAAGLYMGCFDESGTFYDLVRTDALAMGLLAWSLVLCRTKSLPGVIAGGLVLVLTFLTKHNFALFGAGIVGWLFWQDRKLALAFVLASAVPALLITGVIQIASDGEYLTYLLSVPGSHPLYGPRAWPGSEKELLASLILTNLAAAGGLIALGIRRQWSAGGVYWGIVTVIALGACILMRAHHGGFTNVLMPGHWVMAVGGVMLLSGLVRGKPVWGIALALLMGLQLAESRYKFKWKYGPKSATLSERFCISGQLSGGKPLKDCFKDQWEEKRLLPTDADLQAGNQVVAQLAEIEGTVFAPHFPWYPYLAGKEPSMPLIALWDIQHKSGPYYEQPSVMTQGFEQHHWDAVLCPDKPIKYDFDRYYERAEKVDIPRTALKTRTGWRVHPAWIWRPKD